MKEKILVNKSEFKSYERVRQSGVTNMFNVITVGNLTGLTKEKISTIMTNYTKLANKYGR